MTHLLCVTLPFQQGGVKPPMENPRPCRQLLRELGLTDLRCDTKG